jgi:hypothetical protein
MLRSRANASFQRSTRTFFVRAYAINPGTSIFGLSLVLSSLSDQPASNIMYWSPYSAAKSM